MRFKACTIFQRTIFFKKISGIRVLLHLVLLDNNCSDTQM